MDRGGGGCRGGALWAVISNVEAILEHFMAKKIDSILFLPAFANFCVHMLPFFLTFSSFFTNIS